ncbi:MAG: hypothetical protein ACE365_05190 [Gammaproteobacteria bacterium]
MAALNHAISFERDDRFGQSANSYIGESYYDDLLGYSTEAKYYQWMLNKLLMIEGYSEGLIALGSNIPVSCIRGIRDGSITDPGDTTLGKLLRFFAKATSMKARLD